MTAIETVQAPKPRWLRSFGRARSSYEAALVHPDQRRLIGAERDGSVTVWDLATGAVLRRLSAFLSESQSHDARGVTLKLHADGTRLFSTVAIVGLEDITFCWNLDQGNLVETYQYPCVPGYLLDGERAITPGSRGLLVWDLATAKERTHIERPGWRVLDVIATERPAAIAQTATALEVWDLTNASLRWSLPIEDLVSAAALPNGEVLVSRRDGLQVRAGSDGGLVRSLPCNVGGEVVIDRAGSIAVVAGADLVAIELATGRVLSRLASRGDNTRIDIADDGRHAVVSDFGPTAEVWELETGRCRLRAHARVVVVPGSDTAITIEDNVLRQWQLGDDVIATREQADHVGRPMRCPDGRIACSVVAGEVQLTRIRDGAQIATLRPDSRFPRVLAVEPGARRLVIADAIERTLELWRGEPPLRLHTFRSITAARCVAFEPSRRWILSGHPDGSIQRWDTIARHHDGSIETDGDAIVALAVSPRGDRFVASSRDATLRVFDTSGLRELARWDGEDVLRDLAWTDDETIRAASDEGPVVLRCRE